MTDDPWTNRKIQADPEGYLRWQKEQQGKAERARKEAEEQSDFERFAEMFVERGGQRAKAREMYERYRNDQALEAAKQADQATQQHMWATRSRSV
jgi:hypothetical protein